MNPHKNPGIQVRLRGSFWLKVTQLNFIAEWVISSPSWQGYSFHLFHKISLCLWNRHRTEISLSYLFHLPHHHQPAASMGERLYLLKNWCFGRSWSKPRFKPRPTFANRVPSKSGRSNFSYQVGCKGTSTWNPWDAHCPVGHGGGERGQNLTHKPSPLATFPKVAKWVTGL